MKTKIVNKLSSEIMSTKGQILDDFCKAYLASKDDSYFMKLKNDDFRRIELVETIVSPIERTYFFRLKKGRLPKIYEKNKDC